MYGLDWPTRVLPVTSPLFLETEPVLARIPCTLRGDAPLFQPSAFQFRNVHESCQAITVTPVTPSSFPRSEVEPYAGPRADTSLFHLSILLTETVGAVPVAVISLRLLCVCIRLLRRNR